ncbi:MAG: HAD family hydrolase [Chthoniobacterales bacterium]|nr:HAD family hydrolase [Chthoniobacterales bacterium]
MRIAMWSGPRNISTAMMRAWENRPDTVVVDEPFYAHFLEQTRADHPGADEVIAHGETHWQTVVAQLTGNVPGGKRIYYQKQMTHHLLPHISRDWLGAVTNCFLIRDPRDAIASYTKKNHEPALEDLGFIEQAEIFNLVRARTGAIPPVIDAHDVLDNPARILSLLCEAVGVKFTPTMLSWPRGLRASDGIWAKHWYAEVESSSGFRKPTERREDVPRQLQPVYAAARELYERLFAHRLH